jgi:hypothetical protein
MKVSKDTPLAEITLRRYEKPAVLSSRELVRKICLSLGMLQPGDSRDIIVDVLHTILQAKKPLTSDEIRDEVIMQRRHSSLSLHGTASSNIRRQLKRLRGIFIVQKAANSYAIAENASLSELFAEKIEGYLIPSILGRIREYLAALDRKCGHDV